MDSQQTSCHRPDEDYEITKARFAKLYHDHPEIYDIFAKNQIMQSPLLDDIEEILKSNGIQKGNFLDIGCGTGVMIEQLALRFPNIDFTGIDPAENSLELAGERTRNYKNVTFKLGEIEELTETDSKFDVVFSSWGHIHWNAKGGIMERVVKENGLVILVNNWGEGDDFEKLWPNEALAVFRDRRNLLLEGEYNVKKVDSYLDLDDEALFDAISRIFGRDHMEKHRKSPFEIGIVLAWQKNVQRAERKRTPSWVAAD